MQDTLSFMREAVRSSTGAIVPSSKSLAEVLTDIAGVRDANVIVEYGPGTGVFTEVVLRKKKPGAHFIALDINEKFVEKTKNRCPEAEVFHDCAQNAIHYLKEAGHSHCDVVVSGLPWSLFNEDLQHSILDATYEMLRPGGRFATFVYIMSPIMPAGRRFLRKMLPGKFGKVYQTKYIWNNIPPCAVYFVDKS